MGERHWYQTGVEKENKGPEKQKDRLRLLSRDGPLLVL